jgi:hypothetical protein
MTVPVTGLLVFVEPSKILIKERAGGGEADPPIRVLRDTELLDALFERREFSDEQVARIVAAAVRPSTWSEQGSDGWSLTGSEPTSGANLAREFEALEQEVGPRLELPRGQGRGSAALPAAPTRTVRRPATTKRSRPTTSRPRKKKPVWERLLTEVLFPVLGFLLLWWAIQQIWAAYSASL